MANQQFDVQGLANAWNTHSVDKVLEQYAENAEITTPEAPQPVRGKDALRQNVQGWMTGFPDLTGDVERSVVNDREVAMLVHFSGTNRGEIVLGPGKKIPATNKRVEMPIAIFATLDESGKIVKERDLFDTTAYMQQLGISPEQMGVGSKGQPSAPTRR